MTDGIKTHDGKNRYCPMLGHEIHFSYCRAPGTVVGCTISSEAY